ncbi:MAG TPA: nuclear pore complex subunit [Bacteroidales bacterium]|nr:nuclear pore complex subunit [Bacteroidales bacterium]
MKELNIESTSTSPKVLFDPNSNIFEISGESRPENASVFYKHILDWVKDLEQFFTDSKEPLKTPVEFNFNFEYFNSTSAKFILGFCKKLGQLHAQGKPIAVRWHYEEDDEDMLEVGREMSRMAKFDFEYVEIKI